MKTVAFRREINNVQKAAAGRGVGGLPSARIASEVNREFIFSSSYQGDKSYVSFFSTSISSSNVTLFLDNLAFCLVFLRMALNVLSFPLFSNRGEIVLESHS